MRSIRRISRRTSLLVAALGLALAVPAAAQESGADLGAAIEAGIANTQEVDPLKEVDSETVIELGGGRAPIRVVAWSRLAFTDGFDARAPLPVGNGIEVVQDFVPEDNSFYDVSPWRVVHTFKLSETLDGCTGLQEFALFYTVPGAAAFPRIDGVNTPDVDRTHATAMVCENGETRAIHVQGSAFGTQFSTPHRIMLVTAPDPADPRKRCTYLVVITENPDVLVDPTLTTADNQADPASWSWRQYGMGDATQTSLDLEANRLETQEYRAILAAAEPATPTEDGTPEDPVEDAPQAPVEDPPADAIQAPGDDGGGESEEPIVVDVTPEGADDGGGNLIWIVLGVIVVAGVTVVIVRRLRVGGAAGSAGGSDDTGSDGGSENPGSDDASPDGSAASPTGAFATAIAMPGAMVMDPCADERAAVAKAESLLATLTEIAVMRLKNYREKLEDEPFADKERVGDEVEAHDRWYKQLLTKDELLQTAAKDRDEAQLALEAAKRALAECEKSAPPPPEPLDPDTWIPAGKPAAADPAGATEFKIRMMGGGDGGVLLGGGLYKFEIRDMAGNSKLYTFLGGGGVAGAKGGAYGTGTWTEFTTTQPMKVDEFGGWGQIWGASVQVVAGVSAAEIVFFPNKPDVTTQTASGVGASAGLSFGASALHGYWWPE